jgi:carbonic anhydrase
MVARLGTNELAGDTCPYDYVIRTAGSALSEREEEIFELAVENGVKLIVLTIHSGCAAEKAAAALRLGTAFADDLVVRQRRDPPRPRSGWNPSRCPLTPVDTRAAAFH